MIAQDDLKLQLMTMIRDWVKAEHLTQKQAAWRLGIEQPVVSGILKLRCRYAAGWLLDAWARSGGVWELKLERTRLERLLREPSVLEKGDG